MDKYIGTKLIEAAPAYRCVDTGKIFLKSDKSINSYGFDEGYKIKYPDGYESWSPKDVFEKAYRKTNNMNFGLAVEAIKKGFKAARKGWNGKEQYIELATNISYKNSKKEEINVEHKDIGNKAIAFIGTSGVQLGWLASQADMLAEDWMIVKEEN